MACKHERAIFTPSKHAQEAGYSIRSAETIAVAANLDSKAIQESAGETTYPGPLVLPGDDLAFDPDYPEQSLKDAIKCMNRLNRKSGGRHVIYVVAPPIFSTSAPPGMKKWSNLHLPTQQWTNLVNTPRPSTKDVAGYISAFYHGLPVRILQEELSFAAWDDNPKKMKNSAIPIAVALQTSQEAIRIRCRETADGPFRFQVNLNDLLDTATTILPKDAYALLMLIEQDMYEEEDDDFCCGRAYGGSRIACVSMARYHPAADIEQDVDLEHAWPVSHCADYVEYMASDSTELPNKKAKISANDKKAQQGPLRSAMNAYPKDLDKMTLEAYAGLWLGRFCRTASHELGHCFGMDHCLYYACAMQSTASVAEDNRQPPYLCPVDMTKLLHLTGVSGEEHHKALLRFCSSMKGDKGALFWKPFAAWLKGRLSTGES